MTTKMGYKTLYLGSLTIFTIASGLCALAWSFESLVFARVIQAIGAGAILPVGMAIVAELFEPRERGKALGVWGTGIMVAPALGPTLGGYLTDTFNWRSIFSVNLPIGVVTLIAGMIVMGRIYAKERDRKLDLWGYVFLTMALIGGLTALSNGQDKGWNSDYIRICIAFTVVGSIMFLGIESSIAHPLLDLKLFLKRNYSLSMILTVFRSIGLFGSIFLFPIFLQNYMGFTTVQAGLRMMPGAIAVGATMPIAGRLADRYPPAILTVIGCVLTGVSLVYFGELDPLSGLGMIVWPQIIRGMGLAMLMAPLLAAAINSVPNHEIPMASSFLNISQNVGGAMGIALLNNFVTNQIQRHSVRIGSLFPTQSEAFRRFAQDTSQIVVRHAPGIFVTPETKATFAAFQAVMKKGAVMGFENGFVYAGIIMLCAVPICLLLKPYPHHKREDAPSPAAARP